MGLEWGARLREIAIDGPGREFEGACDLLVRESAARKHDAVARPGVEPRAPCGFGDVADDALGRLEGKNSEHLGHAEKLRRPLGPAPAGEGAGSGELSENHGGNGDADRKSTRLNSS